MTRFAPRWTLVWLLATAWMAHAQPPASNVFEVTAQPAVAQSRADARVEAVRESVLAAQVAGQVVAVTVKVGDRVSAGQELVRMDARAAQQTTAASVSQVEAARASLAVAQRDYERQKQLQAQQFVSQAAVDRAQAQWLAAQAQVQSLNAQAGAVSTQAGFYAIKAPFAGVVSAVPVVVGDMALPGKPLVTVYDPQALRLTAAVAQASWQPLPPAQEVALEIGAQRLSLPAQRVQVLPTVDAQTHTVQLRIDLPPGLPGVAPGMFARISFATPQPGATATPVSVPAAALVQRGEMTGVYALDDQGRALLRQVRLGASRNSPQGEMVEVLSGVRVGDRLVLPATQQPAAQAKGR